ncbi:MAG: DUF488 family protein [Streptosporangiaceae bacterium]
MGGATIWTVGHSRHELPALLGVLHGAGIEVVVDVRSQPFSRYHPQFNRERLRAAMCGAGLGYVFLGAELGGRPPEPDRRDSDGRVQYGEVARTERFGAGLRRLRAEADRHRVAVLCSEEDPRRCHRRLLIGRALVSQGISVRHIRGDGSVASEEELGPLPEETSQGTLFG